MSLNTSNDLLLTQLAVRLYDCDSPNPVGSGVLYIPLNQREYVYILTAAHCLYKDGDGFTTPREHIRIDFYDPETNQLKSLQKRIDYRFVSSKIERDVAIIFLDKNELDVSVNLLPSIEIIKDHSTISTFVVKGYPVATQGQEIVCIYPEWIQEFVVGCQFQLKLIEDYDSEEVDGFSGSGIYLHVDNKCFCWESLPVIVKKVKGVLSIANILARLISC
ncbi:MAG: serine protease [Tannerellaceae bacterium]|nr:serine protease [Tannerellaceae bacterium]